MLDIFQWGSWLSVMKYSAEILVANEFQELNFTCPIEPGKSILLFNYLFLIHCGHTFDNLLLIFPNVNTHTLSHSIQDPMSV